MLVSQHNNKFYLFFLFTFFERYIKLSDGKRETKCENREKRMGISSNVKEAINRGCAPVREIRL